MTMPRVLIVDDDPLALCLLERILGEAGYRVVLANSGPEALARVAENADFEAILLDRRIPGMDGVEILHHLKQLEELRDIPVIFQTVLDRDEEIREGLRAGAFYYLTKPLEEHLVLQVVAAVTADYAAKKAAWAELATLHSAMGLILRGVFRFQTLQQCFDLATLLAKACPDPKRVLIGLTELMVNALEHGNLGISYEEKSALIESQSWRAEVERRQLLPEHLTKWVSVSLVLGQGRIRFRIQDMGPGFPWADFQELQPERMFDSHGRGILIAKWESFDRLEYQGCGNCVVAEIGAC